MNELPSSPNPRGEQILSWLDCVGRDRAWFAGKIGASSRNTVDKYFGPAGHVPDYVWKIYQNLRTEIHDLANLELTLEEYEELLRLARRLGTSVPHLLLDFIRSALTRARSSATLRVANNQQTASP